MARGLLQLFLFQGSNPLLVKLDYEVTKVSGKFSKVHLQYSEEFEKVISDNKKVLKIDPLSEDDAVVEVKYLICFCHDNYLDLRIRWYGKRIFPMPC